MRRSSSVAGVMRLLLGGDGVHVRGGGGEGNLDAALTGAVLEQTNQLDDAAVAPLAHNIVQRIEPFSIFNFLDFSTVVVVGRHSGALYI